MLFSCGGFCRRRARRGGRAVPSARRKEFKSHRINLSPDAFCKENYAYSLTVADPGLARGPGDALSREAIECVGATISTQFENEIASRYCRGLKTHQAEWFPDYDTCVVSSTIAKDLRLTPGHAAILFILNSVGQVHPIRVHIDEVNDEYGHDLFWISSAAVDEAFNYDRIAVNKSGPNELILQAINSKVIRRDFRHLFGAVRKVIARIPTFF